MTTSKIPLMEDNREDMDLALHALRQEKQLPLTTRRHHFISFQQFVESVVNVSASHFVFGQSK